MSQHKAQAIQATRDQHLQHLSHRHGANMPRRVPVLGRGTPQPVKNPWASICTAVSGALSPGSRIIDTRFCRRGSPAPPAFSCLLLVLSAAWSLEGAVRLGLALVHAAYPAGGEDVLCRGLAAQIVGIVHRYRCSRRRPTACTRFDFRRFGHAGAPALPYFRPTFARPLALAFLRFPVGKRK